MKTIYQLILWCTIGVFAYSCSDDYLVQKSNATFIKTPTLYVSPDWDDTTYQVKWANIRDAAFTIIDKPRWLKVATTGQIQKGIAHITCSAIKDEDLTSIAIYNANITIKVDGSGLYTLSVGYVNPGNPYIECTLPEKLNSDQMNKVTDLEISNKAEGILFWRIAKCPEWISTSIQIGNMYPIGKSYIEPYGTVKISLNPDYPGFHLMSDSIGQIVIANNSVNSPAYIVNVPYLSGSPRFSSNPASLAFEHYETQHTFKINNKGSGVLKWKIEECPDWLSVSTGQGTVSESLSVQIVLTCNRTGMVNGRYSGDIVFRSNDRNWPLYSLSVRCVVGDVK